MSDIFDFFKFTSKKKNRMDIIIAKLNRVESILNEVLSDKNNIATKKDYLLTKKQPNKPASSEHVSESKQNDELLNFATNNIQKTIINLLLTNSFTLSGLKSYVVDEHNICSKASFYRHFNQLKNKGLVSSMSINGEDRVYIVETVRTTI